MQVLEPRYNLVNLLSHRYFAEVVVQDMYQLVWEGVVGFLKIQLDKETNLHHDLYCIHMLRIGILTYTY